LVDASPPRPLVSVLVCTCNRKDNISPTIRSIRASGYDDFELLVLDQSDDDVTEAAVREVAGSDARVRYVRLPRPSKPLALNEGRRLARGRYILLTDDDCEVAPGWIDEMVRCFESEERVVCVLGDVSAGPHDPKDGYVPICRIDRAHTISTLWDFLRMPGWRNFGMGANMALRADALDGVGGWDPCIGPGADFRSGDDHDTIARLLGAGGAVAFTPTARVVHFGLRPWLKTGDDQARYGFGMGASFAKHLRHRTLYPGPLRVFGDQIWNSVRGLRPGKAISGFRYPRGWLLGFWKGLRHPLDERTGCFADGPAKGSDGDVRVAEVILRREQGSTSRGGDSRK
jgi:glycosyltransferase involved in cell wall biosynthesis